ncbi:hypothetical protein KL921_002804 [Ogataea angusta]|uniref:Scaffold protein Nfu/NifU N-terminal domain-containing protein n=1 Tax=Pichia angusta TaxID=870730 RepID=A0AAN6DDP9_PICAN|nr:uncharacterized protein KL928_003040 [Ogataea angusta]KAG7810309.1 hypothetical protein KL921_002804 [Ogataea angusta]KAG7818039.1 hypothetical protein KL928_003040 [Ogataea angusta]KAG7824490.1 hypothetical protein KL909_001712 [Ogataea angusta]KAG7828947.1 hypothetical protein KL920_002740 [Ogataea angusta]KAG7834253.1 hypothetical protein KL943_003549 [Ogataea angusta]
MFRRCLKKPAKGISIFNRGLIRFLSLKTIGTPNENALKFVSKDFKFLPESLTSAVEVNDLPEASQRSPLASELFKLNGVKSLLIGHNFITVNKVDPELSNNPDLHWDSLSTKVMNVITNAVDSNIPVLNPDYLDEIVRKQDEAQEDDDDITYEIKELINTRIRPALQDDGGDIHFRSFDPESGTVYLKLQGACKSCSLSEDTLKNGIESMLKHYIPEVEEVKAVLDPEEEIALQEFEKLERKLKQQQQSL